MRIEWLSDWLKEERGDLSESVQKTLGPDYEERLVAVFEERDRCFLLIDRYCENPDCDCHRVDLSFFEIGAGEETIAAFSAFKIGLDFDTWENDRENEWPPLEAEAAAEFLRDLDEDWKGYFQRNYNEVKRLNRRIASYRIPVEDVLEGVLIAYSDVVLEGGSICNGGQDVSFGFWFDEKEYLVDDLYCSNPSCDCKEAHLVFFEFDEEESRVEELFWVRLSFGNRIKNLDALHCEETFARRLIDAWRDAHPDIMDILKLRYADIKSIGSRILAEARQPSITNEMGTLKKPQRKIGRNDPCPCGSGKKYKKCCLSRS